MSRIFRSLVEPSREVNGMVKVFLTRRQVVKFLRTLPLPAKVKVLHNEGDDGRWYVFVAEDDCQGATQAV